MEADQLALDDFETREFETRDFEQIQVLRDPKIGFLAFIVIHSTRLGPAFGGIRRWIYDRPSEALADAMRLAEAMTRKCAIHGIPGGGGKAVILQRPSLDRVEAYRLLGQHVQMMGGRYYTGPDVGTEPADLEIMARETEFVASPGSSGPGNLADPTARGVFAGIKAVARLMGKEDLSSVTIAVQGLGEVGLRLARLLAAAGARLKVADAQPERATQAGRDLEAEVVPVAEVRAAACDIFAPCAMGGVIHEQVLSEIKAKAIAGAANNVLRTPEIGEELRRRGILYAPDFVINSGALVHGALFHLEGKAPPPERIDGIGALVEDILREAQAEGLPPEVVAERRARQNLEAAAAGFYIPQTKP